MKPTQEQIDQAIEILRQADNVIAILWNVDDVIGRAEELEIEISEEKVKEILFDIERHHDAEYGITW